jgi:hypothetical protein
MAQVVGERPWWRPGQDDEQDGPLPAVVILEPDYGAELPLTSEEEGVLGWADRVLPQLLDRLADWQEAFEAGHHYDTGGVRRHCGTDGQGRPVNSKRQFARN